MNATASVRVRVQRAREHTHTSVFYRSFLSRIDDAPVFQCSSVRAESSACYCDAEREMTLVCCLMACCLSSKESYSDRSRVPKSVVDVHEKKRSTKNALTAYGQPGGEQGDRAQRAQKSPIRLCVNTHLRSMVRVPQEETG